MPTFVPSEITELKERYAEEGEAPDLPSPSELWRRGPKPEKASSGLAPIKNWTPKHELVVAYHISGRTNNQIAELVEYEPARISQILNDPQAKKIIKAAVKHIREKAQSDIVEKMFYLAEKSAERLGETIDHPFVAGTDAKEHQDKMSVQILKGTGFLSKDIQGGGEKNDTPALTPALANRLVDALEKANQAEEINAVEADYIIEEDDEDGD